MTAYFNGLTGLRGILALMVVLGHCLGNSGFRPREMPWYSSWIAQPHYAVQGFMILSGFVIAHLIITKREPYGLYVWRRWLRLFPLLALCLLGILAVAWIEPRTFPHIWNRLDLLPIYLPLSLSMFHGMIPNAWLNHASTGILPPAWSTSLEWQFYLVAPLLVWPVVTRRYWLLAIMVAIAIPLAGTHYVIGDRLFMWNNAAFLPNSLVYFLLGISVYSVACRWPAVMKVFDPLSARPLVWLGEISYSIYLTHIIVLHIVRVTVVEPLFTRQDWQWLPVLFIATTAGTLAVASITYRWIEQPFIDLGRRRISLSGARSQPAE